MALIPATTQLVALALIGAGLYAGYRWFARATKDVTAENDPRKTRLGSILRATNLDELPQLFNVMMGDMSLVGPRPERPVFVKKFSKYRLSPFSRSKNGVRRIEATVRPK